MNKVFITSMGTITNLGSTLESFWDGINSKFVEDPCLIKFPIELPKNIDRKISRRMDRFSRMNLSVSKIVMENYLNKYGDYHNKNIGTVFNTGYGSIQSNLAFNEQIHTAGVDMVSPTLFTNTVSNVGLGHTCMQLGLKGASTMLMGSNAVSYASDLLKCNKADGILCCGVDEFNEDLHESFIRTSFTTKDNCYLCRPLDKNRDGTRITEGAGAILLESNIDIQSNPDKIFCEILGYANSTSFDFPVCDREMFVNVMKSAIENSSVTLDEIDGVIMGAGGGKYSDQAEAKALHQIFGKRCSSIPVTSIKGAIGETMGASFILNTIAGALTLVKGVMPLTVGCEEPDPELNLNVVYDDPQCGDYKVILINGFDVSGCLFSVVLGKRGEKL
ncbi:beta-ketoacyl synthase N-terminal-like domain-containing protein [Lysinibacillus capsici]|uniref:beta-ketoacyl synthase N-terminal-like domain-containing protein n=1 Tax=Lysinibacillus capsici TaxID=2115968 RepID=UPI002E237EB1|nr:beta-ketoacyl synthase N-terminal-like domain-containing protein [Lysinibacillus capsici]